MNFSFLESSRKGVWSDSSIRVIIIIKSKNESHNQNY